VNSAWFQNEYSSTSSASRSLDVIERVIAWPTAHTKLISINRNSHLKDRRIQPNLPTSNLSHPSDPKVLIIYAQHKCRYVRVVGDFWPWHQAVR